MTIKKLSQYIAGNWDELKGKIQKNWSKLTDDDIESIDGSLSALNKKLHELYGDKIDDLQNSIQDFVHKYSDKSSNRESQLASIKNFICEHVEDYISSLKSKTSEIENKTTKQIKDNPVKWLTMAAVGGFILAKLINL